MELKDYLHFYFGCTMTNTFGDLWYLTPDYYLKWLTENHRAKPVLRPLSDMTEEEARCCWKISKVSASYRFNGYDGASRSIFYKNGNGNNGREVLNSPKQFAYLLRQGFDLFGLIDAGLAIDKTKQ